MRPRSIYSTLSVAANIPEDSLTQKHMAEETDVNHLIARFKRSGDPGILEVKKGFYADVSEITDYRDAIETVQRSQALFDSLSDDAQAQLGDVVGLLDAIRTRSPEDLHDLGVHIPGFTKARNAPLEAPEDFPPVDTPPDPS